MNELYKGLKFGTVHELVNIKNKGYEKERTTTSKKNYDEFKPRSVHSLFK